MIRKLWVGLLILTILLGSVSSFWSKPVVAHTRERRLLCAAWPWDDWEWNKATSPPGSDQNSANSSTSLIQTGNKVEPQKVQQKPQKPFWSRLQFFLFNLKLLFGSN